MKSNHINKEYLVRRVFCLFANLFYAWLKRRQLDVYICFHLIRCLWKTPLYTHGGKKDESGKDISCLSISMGPPKGLQAPGVPLLHWQPLQYHPLPLQYLPQSLCIVALKRAHSTNTPCTKTLLVNLQPPSSVRKKSYFLVFFIQKNSDFMAPSNKTVWQFNLLLSPLHSILGPNKKIQVL